VARQAQRSSGKVCRFSACNRRVSVAGKTGLRGAGFPACHRQTGMSGAHDALCDCSKRRSRAKTQTDGLPSKSRLVNSGRHAIGWSTARRSCNDRELPRMTRISADKTQTILICPTACKRILDGTNRRGRRNQSKHRVSPALSIVCMPSVGSESTWRLFIRGNPRHPRFDASLRDSHGKQPI
jgi:hypothetical protein